MKIKSWQYIIKKDEKVMRRTFFCRLFTSSNSTSSVYIYIFYAQNVFIFYMEKRPHIYESKQRNIRKKVCAE